MAEFKGFVGAAYEADSLLADAQSAINLYVEGIESGDGQNVAYLRETPGLALAVALPAGLGEAIRGIWVGENRLFVVSGSVLYEVFSDNTYSSIGDVGDDGLPVQIFPNGNQLLVVSAGQAWVTSGSTPVPALYPNRFGHVAVDATGLIVTWVDGTKFDASMVGERILIDFVTYVVASFTDDATIGITEPAGEAASLPYQMALAVTGTADTDGTTTITWASGLKFDDSMVGNTIDISPPAIPGHSTTFTVESVTDDTHLVVDRTIATSFSSRTFSATVPVFASQGAFLDGVFIVAAPNSKQMNNSDINDGSSWPLLYNASKQSYPDNIRSLLADHEELYVFGTTRETEVWQTNAASQAFALQRTQVMQRACIAAFSPVSLGEGIAWLGGGDRGRTVAYRATGYTERRVSTHAIEAEWAKYPETSDAVSYTYSEEGHEFWVITFPSGNATWVYDATAAGWHRRGHWNGTALDAQLQMFHGYCFGRHYVGGSGGGNLYIQSLDYGDDAGDAIQRQRAAPHLNNEHDWTIYDSLELLLDAATRLIGTVTAHGSTAIEWDTGSQFVSDMEGLGIVIGGETLQVATVTDATNLVLAAAAGTLGTQAYRAVYPAKPTITLDWSDDGGYTWHAGKSTTPVGVAGRALRTIWRRLGRSRDRIYRATWFGTGKTSIMTAYINLASGR